MTPYEMKALLKFRASNDSKAEGREGRGPGA
jgi:hypothetical protein